MQPFKDMDLGMVLSANIQEMVAKVDSFKNEEIMANDLEILASNLYEEFRIEPVEITDEEFDKRHIEQAKIKNRIDPFFRDYYGKEYVEVDGVIMTFYFPFTGWGELFKCHASMFACGGYPDITVGMMYISFVYEYSLEEVQGENARDKALKKLERDIKDIRDGISYANKDVESYNMSLKNRLYSFLKKKEKRRIILFGSQYV